MRLDAAQDLMKLRVLRLRGNQDGDVRVGVFPECEEILIGSLGFDGVALHSIGSADLEMRECSDGSVEHNSAMVEDFLKLSGGFSALIGGKISFATQVGGIKSGCRSQLIGYGDLKNLNGFR